MSRFCPTPYIRLVGWARFNVPLDTA